MVQKPNKPKTIKASAPMHGSGRPGRHRKRGRKPKALTKEKGGKLRAAGLWYKRKSLDINENIVSTRGRAAPGTAIARGYAYSNTTQDVWMHSTAISSAVYDMNREILQITFTSGHIYLYFGVPLFVYQGLISAMSKGQFFLENIKNQYPYKRVR